MNENTSTALALVPRGLEEAEKMATKLSESSLLPPHFHKQPGNVYWAIALGLEIGFTPVQALQSIYVVHNRPGMYADSMVALILASGHAEYFQCVERSPTSATYETKRRGSPKPQSVTVTIEQAKQAGWTSNKKYEQEPEVMLAARAKSRLAKDVYPDVLRGMASVEELRDEPQGAAFSAPPPPPTVGEVISDAEIVHEEPAAPPPAKKAAPPVTPASDAPAPAQEATSKEPSGAELKAKELARKLTAADTWEKFNAITQEIVEVRKFLGKDHPAYLELSKLHKAQKALLTKAGAA